MSFILTQPILAAISFLGMLLVGAILSTGTIWYQSQQAKKQESQARKSQEAAAKQQAEFAGQQRAIAGAPISTSQMEFVMGQREIDNLVGKFNEQDQTEPEYFTLPAFEPTSPITRMNLAIEDFLR